ncbi:hypothetical protein HOY80DRAFT_878271, partial [Tuber brumale]
FLFLAIVHFQTVDGGANVSAQKAAGVFGIITALIGWWNTMAGMAERSNSFFTIPVYHFPWSEKSKPERSESRVD